MSVPLRVEDVDGAPGRRCAAGTCNVPERMLRYDEATGESWCFNHDPDPVIAEQRALARERGNLTQLRRAAQRRGVDEAELPPLDSLEAARAWLALIARWTATSRITSAQATAMTRAVQEWRDAQESIDLDLRLAQVERRLGIDGEDA